MKMFHTLLWMVVTWLYKYLNIYFTVLLGSFYTLNICLFYINKKATVL